MRRSFFIFLLIPLCMSCLWDRDTLAKDGIGRLDTAKVIVGWFDRYPDRYFQMSLERVQAELEKSQRPTSHNIDIDIALTWELSMFIAGAGQGNPGNQQTRMISTKPNG